MAVCTIKDYSAISGDIISEVKVVFEGRNFAGTGLWVTLYLDDVISGDVINTYISCLKVKWV